MTGFTCLLFLLARMLYNWVGDDSYLVKGIGYAAGLYMPVLSAWLGIIVRRWKGTSALWITIPLALVACYLVVRHATYPDVFTFVNRERICIAMLIMGYLIPESTLKAFSSNLWVVILGTLRVSPFSGKGRWVTSVLLLAGSVICYVVLTAIEPRVFFLEDGKTLVPYLQVAETAALVMAVYAAIAVSFSDISISVGCLRWVRDCMIGICIIMYAVTIADVAIFGSLKLYVLLRIVANPVFVYLAAVLIRVINKLRCHSDESWKSCFEI